MKLFINNDFLLQNRFAEELYHDFAEGLPIIDYHNHLDPKDIAQNRKFENLTQVWLDGDHYKWRAMRAFGIDERYITGDANDFEKFKKWAETVPYTLRNPLYHWTHLELKRYFNIDDFLTPDTAENIYNTCNEILQDPSHKTQGLLDKMNVEILCTTDDPLDDLAYHQTIRNNGNNLKVLPTFRPDKLLTINDPNSLGHYIDQLATTCKSKIYSLSDLMETLNERILYFQNMGCILSDHGLSQIPSVSYDRETLATEFLKWRKDSVPMNSAFLLKFKSFVQHELSLKYHEYGMVQQFHLGAIRNNNNRLMSQIGADAGCDSIGDFDQATSLSSFLNTLDETNQLAKTILYNLNPRDNEVFATMAGNFQDGSIRGKIQWGSAWWFLDQKDGMEKQINTLSSIGLLSQFIGMLTDSRSFLSFPRHEYFRRILCNMLGEDIQKGLLPNDVTWIGNMVKDICYYNAKRYFSF